jgi:hypothetical protein
LVYACAERRQDAKQGLDVARDEPLREFLKNRANFAELRALLQSEFSSENLEFLAAVKRYRGRNRFALPAEAAALYTAFIAENGRLQVDPCPLVSSVSPEPLISSFLAHVFLLASSPHAVLR